MRPATVEKVLISALTGADYDEVMTLWRTTEGLGLSPADSREGIAQFLLRNPGLSFVAREGARLLGAVLCGHDGRRGFIHHLAVEKEGRRRGIGRLLVDRCLAELGREGIQKCHLFVFGNNREALEFWRRLEWTERTELKAMSRMIDGDA